MVSAPESVTHSDTEKMRTTVQPVEKLARYPFRGPETLTSTGDTIRILLNSPHSGVLVAHFDHRSAFCNRLGRLCDSLSHCLPCNTGLCEDPLITVLGRE